MARPPDPEHCGQRQRELPAIALTAYISKSLHQAPVGPKHARTRRARTSSHCGQGPPAPLAARRGARDRPGRRAGFRPAPTPSAVAEAGSLLERVGRREASRPWSRAAQQRSAVLGPPPRGTRERLGKKIHQCADLYRQMLARRIDHIDADLLPLQSGSTSTSRPLARSPLTRKSGCRTSPGAPARFRGRYRHCWSAPAGGSGSRAARRASRNATGRPGPNSCKPITAWLASDPTESGRRGGRDIPASRTGRCGCLQCADRPARNPADD